MTRPDIPQVDDVYTRLKGIAIKYFNKPNFQMYLKVASDELQEIRQMFYDLRYKRTLHEAEGINLDNIGEIVGEPRTYNVTLDAGFFAFSGNVYASGFDEGFWFDPDDQSPIGQSRDDDQYLKAIQAKIYRNNGNATWEDIIQITKTLLGSDNIVINPSYPAGVSVYYDIDLSNVEREYFGAYIQACLGGGIKLVNFEKV